MVSLQSAKRYLLPLSILIIAVIVVVTQLHKSPKQLEVPDVKLLPQVVSANLAVAGLAYPKAMVNVYIDGSLHDSISVNADGTFQKTVVFGKDLEGKHDIKFNQTYRDVRSVFSEARSIAIDMTPPTNDLVVSEPAIDKADGNAILSGTTTAPFVYINGTKYPVSSHNFSVPYKVEEGITVIKFALADEIGNSTGIVVNKDIIVDTTPPKIDTNIFCGIGSLFQSKASEEHVCIHNGQFWGYFPTTYTMPFEGQVSGSLKYLSLNGRHVVVDTTGKIFQKIPLYLTWGTNKFKVVAEDMAGNKSEEYLVIDVEPDSANETTNDDLMNRIDDLESKIDDLENE